MGVIMEIVKAIVLGALQGVAEFLPISSSGHLVIVQELFGMNMESQSNLLFDTLLHVATLVSVFIVYYKDVYKLIEAFFGIIKDIFKGKIDIKSEYRKLILLLIIGTIPAGIIGFLFKSKVEELFTSIQVVGYSLIITGFMLSITRKLIKGVKEAKNTKYSNAFVIGIFQAFALIPGISRSGSTIVGGMLNGLTKEFAVKYSFLLSIPAILGAIVLQIPDLVLIEKGSGVIFTYLAGMVVSAVIGVISIKILIKMLKEDKFHIFAHYCWAVGIFAILYGIMVK
jgi:undecaprenyl-diphosphatase